MNQAAKSTILKSEAAVILGVTPGMVTQLCKKDLKAALVGDRLDPAHPDFQAYQQKMWAAVTKPGPKSANSPVPQPDALAAISMSMNGGGPRTVALPAGLDPSEFVNPEYEDIMEFMDYSVREILHNFGSVGQFKEWLNAQKIIEDIKMKQIQRAEREGDSIPRELVRKHIYGAIENAYVRLLNDLPKSATGTLWAMFKSGEDELAGEVKLQSLISTYIKNLKVTAQRYLESEKQDAT
jgi:hypothetical protein